MFMKMSILIRNACFSIVISPQIDSIHFIIHYLLFEAHDKCTCVSVWICRRPSIHLTLKFEWTKRAIADAKCVFYCLFAILIYQVTPLFYFSPLPFSSSTVCDNWMAHETKPATYALRRSSRTYHALYNCFFCRCSCRICQKFRFRRWNKRWMSICVLWSRSCRNNSMTAQRPLSSNSNLRPAWDLYYINIWLINVKQKTIG